MRYRFSLIVQLARRTLRGSETANRQISFWHSERMRTTSSHSHNSTCRTTLTWKQFPNSLEGSDLASCLSNLPVLRLRPKRWKEWSLYGDIGLNLCKSLLNKLPRSSRYVALDTLYAIELPPINGSNIGGGRLWGPSETLESACGKAATQTATIPQSSMKEVVSARRKPMV